MELDRNGWSGAAEPAAARRGAGEVLLRAARRSGEEAREARESAPGTPNAAFLARAGDLARAQWSLWAWASLAAVERLGRGCRSGLAPAGLSPRALALAAVAGDLYAGYATLRERERWFPGLVQAEDRKLQHRRGAGRLLDAAEALGGSLIKAGQFASTRPDLVPAAYVEGLSSLQDRVPPEPGPAIEAAVVRELGRPPREVFASFETEPLAAASIAQVHRATLADGREVAVKVCRPGIAALVEADLDALEAVFDGISRLEPQLRLKPITDYLRWTLPMELDLAREAAAMGRLRDALSDRNDVVVPEVVEELSTGRIIVMSHEEGVKVSDREALLSAGVDPLEVARLLNDAYADQMFRLGVLHADPHPGNLLARLGPEGPQLVLLDHGLTLDLEGSFVAALARVVETLAAGDLDALTGALREAGLPLDEDAGPDVLLRVVGVLLGEGPGEAGAGGFEGFATRLGASLGDVPPRLLLVGRAIGLLDGITRRLDPDLDALEIVARRATAGASR